MLTGVDAFGRVFTVLLEFVDALPCAIVRFVIDGNRGTVGDAGFYDVARFSIFVLIIRGQLDRAPRAHRACVAA